MKNNLIGISAKIGNGKDAVGLMLQILSYDRNDHIEPTYEHFMAVSNHLSGEKDWDKQPFPQLRSSRNMPYPSYQIKKFADSLKDIVCLLLGCTRTQLEDREFKEAKLGPEWWYFTTKNYDHQLRTRIPYMEAMHLTHSAYELVKLTPRKILQLLGTEAGRQIIHPNIWVNALFSKFVPEVIGQDIEDGQRYDVKDPKCSKWIITDMRFENELHAIKSRGGITIRINRPGHMDTGDHPSETSLDDAEFDYTIVNDGTLEDLFNKVKSLNIV